MRQPDDHSSLLPAHPRFRLGRLIVTEKACQPNPAVLIESLHRHARGDSGPIHGFQAYNNRALRQGGDITSAYLDPDSDSLFLVVTLAKPRRTVIMWPEEYGHHQRSSLMVECE